MQADQIISAISALRLEALPQLTLVQAAAMRAAHMPPFPPDCPALVLGLDDPAGLDGIIRALRAVYPPDFALQLLDMNGNVQPLTLAQLDGQSGQALFIPALAAGASFEAFQEIIAHLRAPEDGCPWDKEQTHLSLRKHLLEEAYETLSALDEQDPHKMREEFGDLLLQIVLNAQIASESAEFNMAGVLQGVYEKIVRRHPHVFGDTQVDGVGQVLANWESIKAGERKKEGNSHKGALDGLPAALPALIQAQEFQDRAARVGFDWPEIDGVLAKVQEEIAEVRAATSPEELTDELGDLFFALVNLARWKKIDAEAALRAASLKFKTRFKYVEQRAHALDRLMPEMSLDELDELWNEAKRVVTPKAS
jgi:tetrapyrrole methylase family protein/MazG family protein